MKRRLRAPTDQTVSCQSVPSYEPPTNWLRPCQSITERPCSSLCIRSNQLEQLIPHLVNFTRIIEGSSPQLSAKRNGRDQISQLDAAHILPELSPFLPRL